MRSAAPSPAVAWHDVECGRYAADLPLWRELARREDGPVLDVGAGTGRVALNLARAGHRVTALDHDAELLAALEARAAAEALPVATVEADAQGFDLGPARFGLVVAPMQTVQLLRDRLAFLAAARRHVAPGGLVAIAIADALEGFEPGSGPLPPPDVGERDGWRFVSQPVAVRELEHAVRIERLRQLVAPDGRRETAEDAIDLLHVDAAALEAEGRATGLEPAPGRRIDPTDEHVGSAVVLLRG